MHSTIYRRIFAPAIGCLLLASSFAFAPRPVSAAMDTYLLFVQTSQGQIKGNSAFPGHQGWIEVESASFGNLALTEENAPAIQRSTSGAGAGKVTFNPFSSNIRPVSICEPGSSTFVIS